MKFISPNVRPTTRDLVIEALVPNPDGKLQSRHVRGRDGSRSARSRTPVVPTSAIVKDETGARVFVVVDKHVQERLVQIGSATRTASPPLPPA